MSCRSAFSLPRLELKVVMYPSLPFFERLKNEIALKKPEGAVIIGVSVTISASNRLWCRYPRYFLLPLDLHAVADSCTVWRLVHKVISDADRGSCLKHGF